MISEKSDTEKRISIVDFANLREPAPHLFLLAHHRETLQSAYTDDKQLARDISISRSWWYRARNDFILAKLRHIDSSEPFWDIGSGTGAVAKFLMDNGISTIALEPSFGGAKVSASLGIDTFCCSLASLRLPDSSVSNLGLFDVIEHLENPADLLEEVYRVLRPGGSLFVTVPALNFLYSDFDKYEKHFRRYNRAGLTSQLHNGGFEVQDAQYFFITMVLPIFLLRTVPTWLRLRRNPDHEADVRRTGGWFSGWLDAFESKTRGRQIIGSSLWAHAVKARL